MTYRSNKVYTKAKASRVIEYMRDGMSLRGACARAGVKAPTFLDWVDEDKDGLAERYSRAQEISAHIQLDECRDIADDGTNDWIEKQGRGGTTYIALNSEHIRRSEIRIAQRRFFFEQTQQGVFRKRRDEKRQNSDLADIVAALGRMAARQQAGA